MINNILKLLKDNSRFNEGDRIDQITVAINLHFEHADGTEY
jgi:hypothetical protein